MSKWTEHIEREALRIGMTTVEYTRDLKERQRREREEMEFYKSIEDGSYWKDDSHEAK